MNQPEPSEPQPSSVAADDALPPVEAPGVGFIMQLFFIPLIIVMIIVMLWLMFSYFAHMGTNPQELVSQIERLNDGSWQKAAALADLLNNPQNQQLKHDRELAERIASVLEREIEAGSFDDKRVKLRMFLALVLGEFRVDTGLPALLEAAETQRDVREVPVRHTALQALAPLISNLGPESLHDHARLHEVLMEGSYQQAEIPTQDPEADPNQGRLIQQAAAYTLGVLGSDAALDRLSSMLEAGYPNTRFNAATALARNGDPRAAPVLKQMLDPANEGIFTEQDLDPRSKSIDEAKKWKRSLVITNGIKATVMLVNANPDFDATELKQQIADLAKQNPDAGQQPISMEVGLHAKEALKRLAEPVSNAG